MKPSLFGLELKKATVLGPLINFKALCDIFSASERWFARWKKHYNIAFMVKNVHQISQL